MNDFTRDSSRAEPALPLAAAALVLLALAAVPLVAPLLGMDYYICLLYTSPSPRDS